MVRYASVLLLGLAMAPVAAASWADGMFAEMSKDFGSVPRGPTVSHLFHFTNNTKDWVHVASVRVSCGCTTATAVDTDVAPGKTGAILAQMDTLRFSGSKAVTIFVQFDRPQWEEVRLLVQAYGRDDIGITPESFSFGQVRHRTTPARTVNVTLAGNQTQVVDARCDSNYVQATVQPVRRSDGEVAYQVTAKLRNDTPVGRWYTDVWVRTNDAASPRIRVPLTVEVEGGLTVSPDAVSMGEVKVGNTVQRKVLVRGDQPFQIKELKGGDGVLSVHDTTPDAKQVHVLVVTLKPSAAGTVTRTIQVVTDHHEAVEFQAKAEVVP
jgi:hypothetical protein